MKILVLLAYLGVIMGCSSHTISGEKDFRKNSIYQNTEFVFDKAAGEPKGTILLIHGTAPQNIDGQVPIPELEAVLRKNDPTHYLIYPTYRELAEALNSLGWNTVRYTRLGVYQDEVKADEYAKTDLKNIMDQLKEIWTMIPTDKPKIAFAWSGGSIHLLQLPLKDASAIVILGGIATKRTEVYESSAKNEKELVELKGYLANVLSQEGKIPRTTMLNKDMSYGRFFDENNLKENWKYLEQYKTLPTLILHGDKDQDVSLSQAKLWQKNLSHNRIEVIIKKNGNHAYGTVGNQPDMKDLAITMNNWLSKEMLSKH